MPLPVLPASATRTLGPARRGTKALIFDSDASPAATGRFAASRPLEKEVRR